MTWALLAAAVAIPAQRPSPPQPIELVVVRLVWPDGAAARRSRDVEERVARLAAVEWLDGGPAAAGVARQVVAGWRAGSPQEARWIAPFLAAGEEGRPVVLLFDGGPGPVGSALWPHQGRLRIGRQERAFVLVPSDDGSGWTAGVLAHEVGHLRGLREHSSGLGGEDCPMAGGYAPRVPAAADPPSYCAPCRARLGWLVPFEVRRRVPCDVEFPEASCAASLRVGLGHELLMERRGEVLDVWAVRGLEVRRVASLRDGDHAVAPAALLRRAGDRLEVRVPPLRGRILGRRDDGAGD